MQPYEERYLFLLLLLRQPRARLIYVTSQPILPSVIDYYLDLLPGVIPSHARPRLFTVPVLDGTAAAVGEAARAAAAHGAHPRRSSPIRPRAHLVPYNTTELERDLAVRLGIPMYGADPRHFPLGTKSGCRQLFEEEGVPYPLGVENLTSIDDVIDAIVDVRGRKPVGRAGAREAQRRRLRRGQRAGRPRRGARAGRRRRARRSAPRSTPCSSSSRTYLRRVRREARRARRRRRGADPGHRLQEPERAAAGHAARRVELLSTHDQLLGGKSGQSYLGLRLPRRTRSTRPRSRGRPPRSGARLAEEGVIGRFALDFVDGARTTPASGRRTRSRSTCARAARRTRSSRCSSSPTAPTTPRPRRSPRRRASRSSSSPATTWRRPRTGPHARRPVRHRRAPRPALRPVAPDRRGVPHDGGADQSGRVGMTAVGDSPEKRRDL